MAEKSESEKFHFIEIIISQSGIPLNFQRKPRTNDKHTRQIFYTTCDNKEIQREWLLFKDNKFYCAYCLCFSSSTLKSDALSKEGLNYLERNQRIVQKLQSHELSANHANAQKNYVTLLVPEVDVLSCKNNQYVEEKRAALKTIIKIIIFMVTHSKYFEYY